MTGRLPAVKVIAPSEEVSSKAALERTLKINLTVGKSQSLQSILRKEYFQQLPTKVQSESAIKKRVEIIEEAEIGPNSEENGDKEIEDENKVVDGKSTTASIQIQGNEDATQVDEKTTELETGELPITKTREEVGEEWLHTIMEEIERKDRKKKVAFLSGKPRSYYPQDPGYSRFAVEYSMKIDPTVVSIPKYLPPADHLSKPVSLLGYGIGGLSADRFPRDVHEENPAPNTYQREWLPYDPSRPPPTFLRKSKLQGTMPGRGSTGAISQGRRSSGSSSDVESAAGQTWLAWENARAASWKKQHLRNRCLQTFIGFGSYLAKPRFGKEPTFKNVGVGYYDLKKREAQLNKAESFGGNPVKVLHPVITNCDYRGYDKCFRCGEILKTVDYYKTYKRVMNPFHDPSVREDPARSQGLDAIITYTKDKAGLADLLRQKKLFVSLCRKCYCKTMQGETKIWLPSDLTTFFRRTRHCAFIHEHHNTSNVIHKTECKLIKRLERKEISLAKYYNDSCPKKVR